MKTIASSSPAFPQLVQDFFLQRLQAQRNASPRTIASYRDTFHLLLDWTEQQLHKAPAALALADLNASVVLAFLDHLERDRHNGVRTRNARLAALRSFFQYAASRDPAHLATIQRVLAIPAKRHDRPILGCLTREQVAAILAALDLTTWSGRRDQALLATLYNTGARVSEALDLRVGDITRGREGAVRLRGKGRKDRLVPLWKSTMRLLQAWINRGDTTPESPLFPNREGHRMNRSGVAHRLRLAVKAATANCPSLGKIRVSPHTFRHTTAMHLLQAGVDITVIAIWLGHESPTTTHRYVEADLRMKQRTLAMLPDPGTRGTRSPSADQLLSFLERL